MKKHVLIIALVIFFSGCSHQNPYLKYASLFPSQEEYAEEFQIEDYEENSIDYQDMYKDQDYVCFSFSSEKNKSFADQIYIMIASYPKGTSFGSPFDEIYGDFSTLEQIYEENSIHIFYTTTKDIEKTSIHIGGYIIRDQYTLYFYHSYYSDLLVENDQDIKEFIQSNLLEIVETVHKIDQLVH